MKTNTEDIALVDRRAIDRGAQNHPSIIEMSLKELILYGNDLWLGWDENNGWAKGYNETGHDIKVRFGYIDSEYKSNEAVAFAHVRVTHRKGGCCWSWNAYTDLCNIAGTHEDWSKTLWNGEASDSDNKKGYWGQGDIQNGKLGQVKASAWLKDGSYNLHHRSEAWVYPFGR